MKAKPPKTEGVSPLSPGEQLIVRFEGSNNICFVRFKFKRPAPEHGVSKDDPIAVVHSWGKAAIGVIKDFRQGRLIEVMDNYRPNTLPGLECTFSHAAKVYLGEKCARNLDEMFCFVAMPVQIPAGASREQTGSELAKFVENLLLAEDQWKDSRTAAMVQERLHKRPPRLPHEQATVDHYANQRQVIQNLLRKQWPLLFAAMDKRNTATTETEKAKCQKQLWLAYIADFTANCGTPPDVKQEEAAELWKDENHIRLMHIALDRGVDKRDWQLAIGWIENGYYRMNEKELGAEFAEDWNYKPDMHKGNTLAKRARTIGLRFALKVGRPDGSNTLPPR